MTKTNTLRSALIIAFAATGLAHAAGPVASGAADAGIDTGANARLSAPAQINKPIGAPHTLNSATPGVPSVAPGVPAVPAVPGNPMASENVMQNRPGALDAPTSVQGDAQTRSAVGAAVNSPTAPAASSTLGTGNATGTTAGTSGVISDDATRGSAPSGASGATMTGTGSARASGSATTGDSDSLVIREEIDAKGNLNAAGVDGVDADSKTKARVKAKKSSREVTQRKAKATVETN